MCIHALHKQEIIRALKKFSGVVLQTMQAMVVVQQVSVKLELSSIVDCTYLCMYAGQPTSSCLCLNFIIPYFMKFWKQAKCCSTEKAYHVSHYLSNNLINANGD